jgi:transposase-like protein
MEVPQDREGTFEPVIVPKHEKRVPLFNDQIISMYSFGMSDRDIKRHKVCLVQGPEESMRGLENSLFS